MATQSSMDVTAPVQRLLDDAKFDHAVTVLSDGRASHLRGRGYRRAILAQIDGRTIAIETVLVTSPQSFFAFQRRARRFLGEDASEELPDHRLDGYWGIVGKDFEEAKALSLPYDAKVFTLEELRIVLTHNAGLRDAASQLKERTEETLLSTRVGLALRRMGWMNFGFVPGDDTDTVSFTAEDAQGPRILFHCKNVIRFEDLDLFAKSSRSLRSFTNDRHGSWPVDGVRVVGERIHKRATRHPAVGNDLTLLTIDGLERQARGYSDVEEERPRSEDDVRKRPKTRVGKAVAANSSTIIMLLAAFDALLSDQINLLKGANSPDKIDERTRYEELRKQVAEMRDAINDFQKKPLTEKKLEKSTLSLRDGVQNWWAKRHVDALDRTYNSGLFFLASGLLGLAGSAVAITGAVGVAFGSKHLGSAIERAAKKWKKSAGE